jgi:hypothetical protein
MDALSAFVTKHDIRLVIPFSINAPQLLTNRNIFQVYQSQTEQNEAIFTHYIERFKNYHTVVVDCNDSTSKKGPFTFGLRRQMEQRGMDVVVTNLKSTEANFSKAFSRTKPNVVILNTGRSQELGVAFSKINGLKANNPELDITMFGYTDWLLYTKVHLENFYRYNTYIPSVFYYNPLSAGTQRFERKYRQNFRSDMQNALPRFAIKGFDHAAAIAAYFYLFSMHDIIPVFPLTELFSTIPHIKRFDCQAAKSCSSVAQFMLLQKMPQSSSKTCCCAQAGKSKACILEQCCGQ